MKVGIVSLTLSNELKADPSDHPRIVMASVYLMFVTQ